jgi:putative polyhydroxyalkanoate system protein
MAKFSVAHKHGHKHDEVQRRVNALAVKLKQKFGITAHWATPTLVKWTMSGASGTIQCHPGAVIVDVDLGFMLSMMKPKIESGLRDELAQALA